MEIIPMKEKIYLAALLQHIEQNAVKKTFNKLLSENESISDYLTLADKYACASSFEKRKAFDYVASPFETLKKTTNSQSRKYKYDFQALNLSENFFPKQNNSNKNGLTDLWNSFSKKFHTLSQEGKILAETTLHLLHKYAVTIPNPSNIHPEVSFYDYAKIKAGLAVCLYDIKKAPDKRNAKAPLLIIRADISGIQDFIGSIASKNASKNLKGRSFYVQLLVDTILKLLLKKLNLYEGNVMYASGGNFFVIAPNIEKVRTSFEDFEKDITAAIFREHKTRIAVVMGCQEVTHSQILNEEVDENGENHGIEKAIKSLFEGVIDKKKKQKFSTVIREEYNKFFEVSDIGGEVVLDVITGEEIGENEETYYLDGPLPKSANPQQKKDKLNLVKKITANQIFLGYHLTKLDDLVNTQKSIGFTSNYDKANYEFNLCELGEFYYPVTDISRKRITKILEEKNYDYKTIAINSKNRGTKELTQSLFLKDKSNLATFMLYGGNKAPVFEFDGFREDVFDEKQQITIPKYYKKGAKKEFSHLALKFKEKNGQLEQDKNGYFKTEKFKRLAVLKMDIDGLGSIFKTYIPYPSYNEFTDEKGNRREKLSFSYYAALSRNLDWFFKGYLNTLWSQNEDFKQSTQIIYSGGDDLFIIGHWDAIIEFSKEIKNNFAKFTLADSFSDEEWYKRVTISGGISIVTDKFPIMKASAFAGNAEHRAKDHSLKTTKDPKSYQELLFKKNSVDLLGVSLHWETEFPLVEAMKNEFVERVGEGRFFIPKSLLSKIQTHAYFAKKYREDKKYYDKYKNTKSLTQPSPKWIWHIMYDLSRLASRLRADNQIFVEDIKNTSNLTNKKFIKNLSTSIFSNQWRNREVKSKYHFLELVSFAARWAELTIRNK